MCINRAAQTRLRWENALFVLLLLTAAALLAWLSTRYTSEADWTASGRNSLSHASQSLLETLEHPVQLTAFARPDEVLHGQIRNLIEHYQRIKSDVELEIVNPDTAPQRVRALGIDADGTLLVTYQERSEKVLELREEALTNALQRLARGGDRWIVFLEGHGERSPGGEANHDLRLFTRELERKGMQVQTINLAGGTTLPDNTSVVVIAGPQTQLLAGEVTLISEYLAEGGNLLWLHDPEPLRGLSPIAAKLGVTVLPGIVVDATTQLFGIAQPDFALVPDYPDHALTRGLRSLTLFPRAAALDVTAREEWRSHAFLRTAPSTWTETGPMSGEIRMDEGGDERAGPLTLGWLLTRKPAPAASDNPHREQRVVVLGDGDFLANAYLGNAGNLDLGLAIFNWLNHDDRFIAIPAKSAPDRTLELGRAASLIIGVGFLLVLPVLFIGSGIVIWLRRRRL